MFGRTGQTASGGSESEPFLACTEATLVLAPTDGQLPPLPSGRSAVSQGYDALHAVELGDGGNPRIVNRDAVEEVNPQDEGQSERIRRPLL